MRIRSVFLIACLGAATATAGETATGALPAGCDTFTWDVSRELAVLSAASRPLAAAADAAAAPRIALDTHYVAALAPQTQVRLAAAPGKPMLDDGATAGLLAFHVHEAGRYRVAITTGHWIDVVDGDRVVPTVDFQGRRGCPLVHKIVEFDLPAGDLLLQFAGGAAPESGVVVTPVDPGAE